MQKIAKKDVAIAALSKLSDEELSSLKFAMPWQLDVMEAGGSNKDEDGFPIDNSKEPIDRASLQKSCWEKFETNPFVGTSIRGNVGRLTGMGFEISSEIEDIQNAVDTIEQDPRNRLYSFWPKYVGRTFIEGELFLLLTVHKDGFIETDFIDPSSITGLGEDGIIYHPTKTTMPLFYCVSSNNSNILIPSIYVAYYPKELIKAAKSTKEFDMDLTKESQDSSNKFNVLGSFNRFIVSWDRSFVTHRNVSYLRTILEWLNHYENLKKYEIDHKKSAGAYLWMVTIEDPKSFRTWLSLTDEERRKTGIMAKKTPGSTLVMPPGMKMEAVNPKLPSISESDTDILHLVTGGLNEPEDMATGQAKGTFASVKASRGPMSDRTSDEIAYFERFLRFDFWKPIFFLMNKIGDFPETFKVKKAVDFKNQEPIFKEVDKRPELLLDISFPTSELSEVESRAKAYLGVKHGAVDDTLGIPKAEIAKKMGFGNYRRMRLRRATEEDRFPELLPPVDSGGEQLEPGVQKSQGEEPAPKKKVVIKKK